MDVKFIQIGNVGINLAQIIDITFEQRGVYIVTTERDGDGSVEYQFTGDEANAIKDWWEDHADVYRII